MKKFTKILWGALCAGVLLMGVGTGMAVATYASFDYDPDSLAVAQEEAREEVSITVPQDAPIDFCHYGEGVLNVVYEKSVPKDEVRLELSYNPVYADADVIDYSEDGQTLIEILPICRKDSFELFMESKNEILEGLKNGVLMTFDESSCYAVDVTAYVNPVHEDPARGDEAY